jgi:hypothetical protein
MNLPDTPLLGLRRFLDSENISQIEFEAELCGFAQFLREAGTLSGRRRPVRVNPDYNPVPSIPGK